MKPIMTAEEIAERAYILCIKSVEAGNTPESIQIAEEAKQQKFTSHDHIEKVIDELSIKDLGLDIEKDDMIKIAWFLIVYKKELKRRLTSDDGGKE